MCKTLTLVPCNFINYKLPGTGEGFEISGIQVSASNLENSHRLDVGFAAEHGAGAVPKLSCLSVLVSSQYSQ